MNNQKRGLLNDVDRSNFAHKTNRNGLIIVIFAKKRRYDKQYNIFRPHVKGDECLQAVAQTVARCLKRPTDLAARYGGEEFVCLLPDTDVLGAVSLAESIRKAVMSGLPFKK